MRSFQMTPKDETILSDVMKIPTRDSVETMLEKAEEIGFSDHEIRQLKALYDPKNLYIAGKD